MTDSAQPADDAKTSVEKRGPGRPRKDTTVDRTERKDTFKREAFNGRRLRLTVTNKDPAFHYGWFRDQGDNMVMLRRAGYKEVSFREAEREIPEAIESVGDRLRPEDVCRTHGGTGEGGVPYKMILMKQPMEFFKEDQAGKQELNAEIDQAIYRPEFADGKVVGNTYGEINLSVKDKE